MVGLEGRSGYSGKEESFLPPNAIEPAFTDLSIRSLVTILNEACGSTNVS